jgi:hypothetical protein
MQDLSLGVRLDTYRFHEDEMRSSIDQLLSNQGLRSRMEADGQEIRSSKWDARIGQTAKPASLCHSPFRETSIARAH